MKTLIPALICLFLAIPCQAEIIYVDTDANGANNGTSWGNAYNYLQDVLADPNLFGPAEIWVAEGTYKPDQASLVPITPGDRTATFQLISDVAVYGGFPSGGGNWGDRDPNAYETILSGDLNGDDEPNFVNNDENSYHVVTGSGTDANAILDGFTITAGNANLGSWPDDWGGGMLNIDNSNPTLNNCEFNGNSAKHGGGMHNSESSPTLINCAFNGNTSSDSSGGMDNWISSPTLTHCNFNGNSAVHGGAMFNNNSSSPILIECTFSGNTASGTAGGMNNANTSNPTLTNCSFTNNNAEDGGGMFNTDSSPMLINCTFTGNYTGDWGGGGGMCNWDGSNSIVTNCTFSGNSAGEDGGGMHNLGNSSPTLTNCTFTGNSVGANVVFGGGGLFNWTGSSPTLTNCVFIGNASPKYGGAIYNGDAIIPTLTNCTFSGNSADWAGGGIYLKRAYAALMDSEREFSDTQGQDNWYYGYYISPYTSATFQQLDTFDVSRYLWYDLDLDFDYPLLWPEGGIPGFDEWVVRRWISEVAGEVEISGWLANSNPPGAQCGDGTTGRIIVDGNEVWSQYIDASDDVGVDYSITVDVDGGSIIDFAIDPYGSTNWCDQTTFTAAIWQITPTDFLTVSNCILWGNTAPDGPQVGLADSSIRFIYCDLQGGQMAVYVDNGTIDWGDGNITDDPLLKPDNYHIQGGSPCIDAGDPNDDYTGQTDIDGEPRVINGLVDIGADELPPPIQNITQDTSYPNIQEAINDANDGDTIVVQDGTYTGTGNRDIDFDGKAITLTSQNGPNDCIIDCESSGRGFYFHNSEGPNSVLDGFTIVNGYASDGGGIKCTNSSPTIRNCVISGNYASDGGGIYCWSSNPTISNCTISDNSPDGVWISTTSTLLIEGTVYIVSNNIVGEGSLQIDPNASLNLDDAEVFCNMSGAGTMEIEVGAEATIDGNAIIDLGDPCDPNVRGTIDCEGLLQVKDNAQIINANINITRATFEDDANVTNCEIHVDSNAPYGQFFIDANASFTYNDIHADGDRYMDLDPNIFSGLFVHNRIFVTITEGVGQTSGGLFELRGDPKFADPNPNCDPNEFMCQMDPCTIPDCNLATWTIERLELTEGAKLNLTNRFGFQPPYDPGNDDDVLYVKELVLCANSVLNTSYNWVYYGTLVGDLNAVTNIPLLGFSLINIALDDELEFKHRVTHNNFDLEPDPCDYTRIHVKRVEDNEPDPNGMMQMCNLLDLDPCSLHYQEMVNARAKGLFAKASEDEDITITFEYMFIEDPCTEAEIVIYLSDKPEVNESIVEVARIRPPAPGRPGSIGSGRFAVFSGTFLRGDLNFKRGTYVELELRGTGTRCLIDNWDPTVYCIVCGDYDGDLYILIYDYLVLLAEFGLSNPASATPLSRACLDLDGDGCVDAGDLLAWDVDDVLNACQLWESLGSTLDGISTGETLPLLPEFKVQNAGESEPLLILGKPPRRIVGEGVPDSYSYSIDSNGICIDSALSIGNGRLMTGSGGNIYQIHGNLGLLHQDTGIPVVEPNDNLSYEGSLVSVGINNEAGLPLADAVFSPAYPNIVYVVPVLVDPQDGNCPYMAAAKLELTGADDYNLVKLYGKNPAESDPCNTPKDCDGYLLYEPDVQHLSEIEIDSDGNLFVLSTHWFNENNWILIYNEATGNDSEVRVQISEPNVTAPTAMVVSSIKKKLYLASSVITSSDLTTEVYRFSIDKTTPSEPNLVFDNTIDINCPEPAICDTYQSLCETGLGYISTITSMIENPADGTLYVTGFTAPKFAEGGELPSQIIHFKGIFTTPMLAVLPPDSNGPVEATKITDCDLALPLSIVWTWTQEKCGGADLDDSGEVSFTDFSILARYWLDSNCDPSNDYCNGADLEPEDQPDGDVDMADLAILAWHWLETGCLD